MKQLLITLTILGIVYTAQFEPYIQNIDDAQESVDTTNNNGFLTKKTCDDILMDYPSSLR